MNWNSLDYTKSVTTDGKTVVFVNLLPTTKAKDVPYAWLTVRNMIGDIQSNFPSGVQGPFFNDRFGDVYGNIYAFTSDGLTERQLRDQVEFARSKVLTVPNVGQVEILGARDEAVYLDFSTRKVAALGLDATAIANSLRAQNAIAPSGTIEAGPERISVRVDGQFTSEASLQRHQPARQRPLLPADRRGDDPARPRRSPGFAVPLQRQAGHRAGDRHEGGVEPARFRRRARKEDARDRRRSADRRRRRQSVGPAGGGGEGGLRLHRGLVRGHRHRAGDQLHQPGPARGAGGGDRDSAGAGDHLPGHVDHAVFRCNAFRSARSSSRSACWSTMR